MRIRIIYLIISMLLFQTAFGMGGYQIDVDGRLSELSLSIAKDEIGKTESGQNRGRHIKEYLDSTHAPYPASYCAAGIYWSFSKACSEIKWISPDRKCYIPIPRTAVANAIYNYAARAGKKVPSRSPSTGDLLVWKRSRSWQGHIERVCGVLANGKLQTIGFNTKRPPARSASKIAKKVQEGVWLQTRVPNHPLAALKYRGAIYLNEVN